ERPSITARTVWRDGAGVEAAAEATSTIAKAPSVAAHNTRIPNVRLDGPSESRRSTAGRGLGVPGRRCGERKPTEEDQMADVLKGKKVAILAADMFERVELEEPRKALEDAGADVEVVSIHDGEIKGFDHFDPANTVPVCRTVEEGSPDDYDALLVPGGVGNPDQLRGDENAVSFVRGFDEAGKPMAVICHGPWVLVESGVVRGKRLTSWPTLATDIRNAGGEWTNEEVVVDGNIVTSRKPDDIPAFNREMLRIFSGERVPAGGRGRRRDPARVLERECPGRRGGQLERVGP